MSALAKKEDMTEIFFSKSLACDIKTIIGVDAETYSIYLNNSNINSGNVSYVIKRISKITMDVHIKRNHIAYIGNIGVYHQNIGVYMCCVDMEATINVNG